MTTTHFDSLKIQNESTATGGSVLVPATALGILLAVACHSSTAVFTEQRPIQIGRTVGTLTHPESRQRIAISEKDLVKQLARVYDQLLAGQVEMDESVRSAIYPDLWGLYE